MAGKRSQRIPEVMEKSEVNCVWGLLSILQSCQGGIAGPKLISNGRPVSRHVVIADHPRKPAQITSFDEECRKIQNVDVARVGSNGSARSARDHIREELSTTSNAKQVVAKGQQQVKMDSAPVDHLAKMQRKARKKRDKAYQSSSSRLDVADKLIVHQPSASAEISLNRLTLAALLQAVAAQNHPEEGSLSQCLHRGLGLGKYNQADQINMQQVQASAKDFVDRMFIDGEFTHEEHGMRAESKSFSTALEVLNSDKDRLMDLLPEPDSLLSRGSKNFRPSRTERDTIKSLLDAKLAEYKRENVRTSGKSGSTVAIQKGKMNKQLRQKIEYPHSKSTKTSFAAQPADKILALEPATRSAKNSEYVSCNCSSVQSQRTLSRLLSDAKLASFTFRETKKKLKHAFGSRKEENQCSMNRTSDGLVRGRSTRVVGDDCVHSFDSLANENIDGKLCKIHEVGCATDDISKKAEFYEVKRRLSERLRKLSEVEAAKNKKSTRTLRRILASPEHDFCPLSPRRQSQYCSSSAQIPNGRERTCFSPSRSGTTATACYDYNNYDDSKKCSLIPSPDDARETKISAVKKSIGETMIAETSGIQEPESRNSDVSSEMNTKGVTTAMQMADATELHKDDDSVDNFSMDSRSENNACISTADDFQSTSSSVYQLDSVDNAKYQEEHQSPVSVLEPFFIEDASSPQNMTLQTVRQTLQPLRLDFEEQPSNPFSHDPSISLSSCREDQDSISEYVYSVLQVSCLDWDQLSKILSLSEELLDATVFDEVEFLLTDCCFDPKLLFDHINDVLVEIHRSHFCSCLFPAPIKPRAMTVPLAQLVLNEIMTQADFYLHPRTEKRTLDQLTSKDVGKSQWWLDVRLDTEQIVVDISEDFLEECLLDMLIELET